MKKDKGFLERLTEGAELLSEPLPGQPIIEIGGDRRVVIENHGGVTQYSREKIGIKVKFGTVCVCGCALELIRMSREQLIISGRIDSVHLIRRAKQ